jgi:hypothetical protein
MKYKIFKKSPETKRCGTCYYMDCKRPFVIHCSKHNFQIEDIHGKCGKWELGKRGVVKAVIAIRDQREQKKSKYIIPKTGKKQKK